MENIFQIMNWVPMNFGGKNHYNQMIKPTKCLKNPVHNLQEIKHYHLQHFFLYLDIYALDFHDLWWGEEMNKYMYSYKILQKPNLYFERKWFKKLFLLLQYLLQLTCSSLLAYILGFMKWDVVIFSRQRN